VYNIFCIEGEPFSLEPRHAQGLVIAVTRLQQSLKPSFRILTEERGSFTINGIFGAIDLGRAVLQVAPKTDPDDDWISAALDLLIGSDRVDASGERAAGLSRQRRDIIEVLGAVYAARLERAFRRDGPILVMEHQSSTLSHLKGKLDSTLWVRNAILHPHRFPVSFSNLSADNSFNAALSLAAELLSRAVRAPETRGRLLSATRGLKTRSSVLVTPATLQHHVPPQWASYAPAWSVALAVLKQRSLLGAQGRHVGVSIAIEAWPLLERLLERSLAAAAHLFRQMNRDVDVAPKAPAILLQKPVTAAYGPRSVIPDGLLVENGLAIASFEAKYKRRGSNWPDREDIYQSLATAAACGSPFAVLVYPERFAPVIWPISGMHGQPKYLAAIGLDLFSYRLGVGDTDRGKLLKDLIAQAQGAALSGTISP
jgi:hypothetical protein